ncbi:NAD-dependent epimerase/dehydratase family protein [Sulfuricurvum sp.]|uniref:NAD-dependent epimerase/dehydratase family protein n=1 Tax=Sulfuricurvum sp. TaxID=2025608 RepID=UPI0035662369
MKIAVTGATGFIARHLIPILKADHEIIAIARFQDPAAHYPWLDGIEKVAMDITNPQKDMFALMGKPDALIHLAWGGLPNYKSPDHLIEGAKHLLFLSHAMENGLKNITVIGTCFEYGMKNGELSENDITEPSNPYGLAKDSLRKALEFLTADKSCTFRWIRLFYLYGEGQNQNSLLSQLDRAIESKEPIFNMSGGEQLRDYLPVEKAARYIALIATQNAVDGIINCCSGNPISVRKLIENRIKEKSADISLNLGFYPYPDYEPMAFWGNNTLLNQIIKGNHQ